MSNRHVLWRAYRARLILPRFSAGKPQYDLALSRRYNEVHHVWAGAEASEKMEVNKCTPRKYRAVHRKG